MTHAGRDTSSNGRVRRVAGCMSGTSLDGIDAAVVRIEGAGLAMRASFERGASVSFAAGDAELGRGLRDLAEQRPMSAGAIAGLMERFAALHVRVLREALAGASCDLICCHGQTVFHQPPRSWQLLEPAPIAWAFGRPVVCNLRQMDLAAGGQGAPITPIADWVMLRSHEPTAVVNLGGFCNVTLLPGGDAGPEGVRAMDVCACNQILDAVARVRLGSAWDEGGTAAARGRVDEAAAAALRGLLEGQRAGGRSLGTGDELAAWIERDAAGLAGPDAAASACEAVAACIAGAVHGWLASMGQGSGPGRVLLAGGGVKHARLAGRLAERLSPARVGPIDEAGLPASMREAAGFAVLGALCADGVAITLPAVTGVGRAPIAGQWVLPGGGSALWGTLTP